MPPPTAPPQSNGRNHLINLHDTKTGATAVLEYNPITPFMVIQNYETWTSIVSARLCHAMNKSERTPYQLSILRIGKGTQDITLADLIAHLECAGPAGPKTCWLSVAVEFTPLRGPAAAELPKVTVVPTPGSTVHGRVRTRGEVDGDGDPAGKRHAAKRLGGGNDMALVAGTDGEGGGRKKTMDPGKPRPLALSLKTTTPTVDGDSTQWLASCMFP
ncbi:hypothetical protein DFH27DRAFT_581996 [Peziza echinospora]|nr:hypothetical protein DFH27DRAFT_581996 [Peziza echinospora]